MDNKLKAVIIIVLTAIAILPMGVKLMGQGQAATETSPPGQNQDNSNPAAANTSSPYHRETPPPFVDDPAVIGEWKSVDFVQKMDDFKPGKQLWTGDLYLKGMTFMAGGRTGGPWQWSKGVLFHPGDKSLGKYEIKELGGARYLFMEWISGDVLIRGQAPRYYVLKFAS
jgi:hypothetical protein